MAISHADHDHPNTPAARAACRKAMGSKPDASPAVTAAVANHQANKKAAKVTVVPRTRGDGGVVKGMKKAAPLKNNKKPGTHIRGIGDLPDVPAMLAYGARLAWSVDWDVIVGEKFNDEEARLVVKGAVCEIALVWKVSLPHGVWGVFVRNWNSSKTFKVDAVQYAFELAMTPEAWDKFGNLIGA